MDLEALSGLVTLCFFGTAGWLISRRIRVPVPATTWVLLSAGVLVGMYTRFWLLSAFGFTIFANWAIVSCCLGILVGLTVRTITRRRIEAEVP